MKKVFFSLAVIAALVSCSKENPSAAGVSSSETYSITLEAAAPSSSDDKDTKTALSEDYNVYWSKGDAIKVLFFPVATHLSDFAGSNGIFTSNFDSDLSTTANFTNDSWSWGFGADYVTDRLMATGIAVYPSSATATSSKGTSAGEPCTTEVYFELPSEQTAIKGNIESNLNFSYATVDRDNFKKAIDDGTKPTLYFKNACSIIKLTMPSDLEKKVTSIAITSNSNVPLTGKGNIDMDYWKNQLASPFHVTPEGTNGVTLTCSEGFEADGEYYAVVWPGVHESGLKIIFTAEDNTVATLPTSEVTLSASVIKPYKITTTLSFGTEEVEHNYVYSDGSTGNEVKDNIVGVIFYHGNPKEAMNDTELPDEYCHGLAISVTQTTPKWHTSTTLKSNNEVQLPAGTTTCTFGGYTAKTYWEAYGTEPAIYNSIDNGFAQLPANTSGWYLGTNVEWEKIAANISDINSKLEEANGVKLTNGTTNGSNGYYLPYTNNVGKPYVFAFTNTDLTKTSIGVFEWGNYEGYHIARPIFAF